MDPLRTRVKAAAVANLTDARYFAALGVDYLGFALEPGSEGHIGALEVAAFREWIEGPRIVGEFGGMPTPDIARLAAELDLHLVEVGPFGKTHDAAAAAGLPVLQRIPVGPELPPAVAQPILDANAAHVEAFVLDFSRGGLPWAALREERVWTEWLAATCADYPVLLDLPAPASAIEGLLGRFAPLGFQVRGGEEEAVGVKSFDDLDAWFDVLRVEE